MAYDAGYQQQQRPYKGPAASRPVPQRQYPPTGAPQQYDGPQQYDQYPNEYGYGQEDYGGGQGYGQDYGGQYGDMNYRGPPEQTQAPSRDYGPGPGLGRGRPAPAPRGRGGPPGAMQRPPPNGGQYPPRGRGSPTPPGPGRGGYPAGPGRGRPGPPERMGGSDPSMNRGGRMNPPPRSPHEPGFGGSPFPTFLGQHLKTDQDEEQQIVDQMEGMDISGRRPQPPADRRGPSRPYPPQGYSDRRREPGPGPGPGPGQGPAYGAQGGYGNDGYGPPARAMTMPTQEPSMDMRSGTAPPRSESVPYNGSYARGPAARPGTSQSNRPPPQRIYPGGPPPHGGQYGGQNFDTGYREPEYDQQQRPTSMDDFYDSYYDNRGSEEYAVEKPPSAHSDVPDFDAAPQRPRNSFEQSMAAPAQGRPQRGPNRYPVVSRAKSQPDLRNSQEAVLEMAHDIPPIPSQYGGPGGYDPQAMNGPGQFTAQPGMIPDPSNPDALPSHPTPVRPGLMANPTVSQIGHRPPPVRNYNGTPVGQPPGPLPPTGVVRPGPVQEEALVTPELLERFRNIIKADPNDQITALFLAKKLVEAADVLVPALPDPRSRAKSRERYLMDAQKILKKLANAQNPEAMFFLADCLGRGLFSAEPDNKEAFTLYQSAAKLGNARAAYRTAVCCEIGHEEGGGTRKDPLKAMQWYKRAATLGDPPAMYKVGMILLKGLLGQPKNPREAVGWLKRAAERADAENPHALHELGLLYESAQPNDAILRDETYALTLFQQAAELGYKFSQFRLGCAFEYGLMGCLIDPRLSIMWYSRAAAQEEHQSELSLSGWYLTGSEGVLQQSDTEAYLWARKAAMAGLAKAEYAMGYFTEVGIGVPANLDDAKRWYWRAAAQDFPKARERLEDLKRTGQNTPRQRERISRSRIGKQQEGECLVM